jgi:quercetin dioxygenase-like cupin family protein
MTDNSLPDPPIRRIVTTHDEAGKAVVMLEDAASNHKWSGHGNVSTMIWSTDRTPAEMWTKEDYGARIVPRQPPPMGSRFAIIDMPPGSPGFMHRPDTLDYVICLDGTIDMDLDDSTVTLRAGDVLVQQGTNHAWVNRSQAKARVAFVLLDALPKPDGRTPPRAWAAPRSDAKGAAPEPPIRRVVTTHDRDGKAVVMLDGPATTHKWSGRGTVSTLIWSSDRCPADIWTKQDYGTRLIDSQPPPMGSRFAMIDHPPGTPGRMHRTDSVDYVICLKGRMRMEMDDSAVVLRPGDVLVQQGTNHAWVNEGDETCRLAFVLMDAKPKP